MERIGAEEWKQSKERPSVETNSVLITNFSFDAFLTDARSFTLEETLGGETRNLRIAEWSLRARLLVR